MTSTQVARRLPNGVRFQPNLRGFERGGEDFSIIKRTRLPFINEVSNFEFRADMTNIFNRTWLNNPRTDIGVPAEFGRVFEKYGGGRTIQLGLRIAF
jgi:outer membrane receptor protein involved in Fe transport